MGDLSNAVLVQPKRSKAIPLTNNFNGLSDSRSWRFGLSEPAPAALHARVY